MSHDLEIRHGKASFAFNKENGDPWHKLGTPVEGYMTMEQAMELAGANWTVEKTPIQTPIYLPIMGEPASDEDWVIEDVESKCAIVRPHPDLERRFQVLGVHGAGYEPVQNARVLQGAYDVVGASDGSAHVDTLGVLGQGERLFAYIALEDLVIDPTGINDVIERGLVLSWSHDGSTAVTYAFTDVRAVCANTVQLGVSGAKRVFKAKHTSAVDGRITNADKVLGVSADWAKAFAREADLLLGVNYTEDRFEKVLTKVFPEPLGATERQKRNAQATRTQVRGIFANERNSQGYGANGWTMWNAIVEYLDHGRDAKEGDRLLATMDVASWVNKTKERAADVIKGLVYA